MISQVRIQAPATLDEFAMGILDRCAASHEFVGFAASIRPSAIRLQTQINGMPVALVREAPGYRAFIGATDAVSCCGLTEIDALTTVAHLLGRHTDDCNG